MKQSKGRSFKASTYPTFMSIARLKASLPGKRGKLLDRSSRKSEAKDFERFRASFLSNEIRFTLLCTLVLGQRTRFRNEYSSIKSFASYLYIGGLERTGEAGEKVGRELYLRSTLCSFHYSFNILQMYAGVKSFCLNVIISLPRYDSVYTPEIIPFFGWPFTRCVIYLHEPNSVNERFVRVYANRLNGSMFVRYRQFPCR